MKLALIFAFAVLSAFGAQSQASSAAQTACPAAYLDGEAPLVTNPTVVIVSQEVCLSRYAIAYAGPHRAPAWSAVRLTQAMAHGGDIIDRINPDPFHDELAILTVADRSTYHDYDLSGYDRGHMTPADDMPDFPSQRETFSMANMVPQRGGLNSGIWASLENRVQQLAVADGEVFVVTGPVFGPSPAKVAGRISIPLYTFKAVYSPRTGVAAGYLATNEEKPTCWALPISQLEAIVALDLFPSLALATKQTLKAVPKAPGKCRADGWIGA